MNWFQLIVQLLPSVLGIIQQILIAIGATPTVHAPLESHIKTATSVINAHLANANVDKAA